MYSFCISSKIHTPFLKDSAAADTTFASNLSRSMALVLQEFYEVSVVEGTASILAFQTSMYWKSVLRLLIYIFIPLHVSLNAYI